MQLLWFWFWLVLSLALKDGEWLLYQRQGICVGLTSEASCCCLCESTECGGGFSWRLVSLLSKYNWSDWFCKLFHEFHCSMEGWKWYLAFACDWLCNCFDFGFLTGKWILLWLNNILTQVMTNCHAMQSWFRITQWVLSFFHLQGQKANLILLIPVQT